MSEHTLETVIKNKNATIARLVKERDKWKRKAERLSYELLTTSLRLSEMECEFSQQKGDKQ